MFYGFSRLRADIFFKLLISAIAVLLIVYIPNYGKLVYKNMKTVTNEMINQGQNYKGYQPGEDIVSVKSVAEMDENEYFTIEVSKDNIVQSGYYVEDVSTREFYRVGAFKKYIGKILKNLNNRRLVQFCVVTLQDGEKCIVLIDTDLIKVNSSKTIKLPIGEKDNRVYPRVFSEITSGGGVSSQEYEYFVDTTCDDYYSNESLEQLNTIKGWVAVLIYITTYIIFTKINKKFGYESEVEMIKKLFNNK